MGASQNPGKWGFIILANILNGGYRGKVYPVNPREKKILGVEAWPSVESIPGVPDLAVVVVPPPGVPRVISECAQKGIKAALVITAGFAEVGAEGVRLQAEAVRTARQTGMVMVGPNCQGTISTGAKLHALMPPLFPPPGPLSMVTQSGNVGGSVARHCMSRGFGFSKYLSTGNEAALHCEEVFEYLADDPNTKVILSYVEGFKDGRSFFETAKKVTARKPIVMIKGGRTAAGAKAAKSHTASLAGSDAVIDAACRQAGVIRVRDMDELFCVGASLAGGIMPRGRGVGIVTAGGGWGVLAADACARAGLEVVTLPEETMKRLDACLPAWWNRSNPVDLVSGLRPGDLQKSLEVLFGCPRVDGVILLGLMPALPLHTYWVSSIGQEQREKVNIILDDIGRVFSELMVMAQSYAKPLIVASDLPFGGNYLESKMLERVGEKGGICFTQPEQAALVFASMARYAEYLRESNS
jgi:acyl-CoA synthetase (NDP forming)